MDVRYAPGALRATTESSREGLAIRLRMRALNQILQKLIGFVSQKTYDRPVFGLAETKRYNWYFGGVSLRGAVALLLF